MRKNMIDLLTILLNFIILIKFKIDLYIKKKKNIHYFDKHFRFFQLFQYTF